ncbi:hypothetical protein BN2476_190030 [Paraburkholderia piptadeniae]|uniref:Uncharacterized protein n=1 Tax=Paraburkholderia piptadeniae TaxID=1701573 RepID=A0A1N7RUP8_9BURK|nr:hypothetical protein BN2476_190030 [Paraburkholderia piptadeniae]
MDARGTAAIRRVPADGRTEDDGNRVWRTRRDRVFLWPKELLEKNLNRNALASTVQHDFFDGNPSGWKRYVAHMQKKVSWFGTGLPEMKSVASEKPAYAAAEGASPVEASVESEPPAE